MNLIPRTISRYFDHTHSLVYSYLISLPLLILYEALIVITQPDPASIVRISVDVWIKQLFQLIGYNALSITLLLVACLGLFIFFRDRKHHRPLYVSYFMGILLEAVLYAILLAFLISSFLTNILQLIPPTAVEELPTLQQIALSLGAGLYEELFFRVFLIFVLFRIFKFIFSKNLQSYVAAVLIGALIFSLAHYTGTLGDPFTLGSFLFRFVFGLALNVIYVTRGFGVTAWTHAFYDIMVVAFL